MSRLNWISRITLLVIAVALIVEVPQISAQKRFKPDVRFGKWKMDSDAPAPQSNIMTYEPWGTGGMKITVATVNAQGQPSQWSYETLFDGEFRPVTGQDRSETAVEFISDRATRIQNKRNGKVYQIVINTLSEDGNTINNEYVRLDDNGKITGVTHAVYRRMK